MDTIAAMITMTHIKMVEKDGDDGVFVTFSDGTTAGYVAEELLLLRPNRLSAKAPLEQERPATIVEKIKFPIDVPPSS